MEFKKQFKNVLLNRTEIEASAIYDANPGLEKVKQDIASKFKTSPETVFVKNIISSFGSNNFFINAFVYDSVEDMNKVEARNKKKKKEAKK